MRRARRAAESLTTTQLPTPTIVSRKREFTPCTDFDLEDGQSGPSFDTREEAVAHADAHGFPLIFETELGVTADGKSSDPLLYRDLPAEWVHP